MEDNSVLWKKGHLSIVYKNPNITPFRMDFIESIEDVMYFYYDIEIMDGKTVLFSERAHDFPKVPNLYEYIDYILELKEEDMFVYEDYKYYDFHRKKLYSFTELEDSFGMNAEYFYKIEKIITYVKQMDSKEYKRDEEYTLSIGRHAYNKEGYSNGEDFGQSVFIKYLTRDDLLNLRKVAEEFCDKAVKDYNEGLKEFKIKCPKCEKHQLYLNALVKNKEEDDPRDCRLKCVKCGFMFTDDDDCYIDEK